MSCPEAKRSKAKQSDGEVRAEVPMQTEGRSAKRSAEARGGKVPSFPPCSTAGGAWDLGNHGGSSELGGSEEMRLARE